MVKTAVLAAALAVPLAGHAANYLIVCAPGSCVAADGTTQPAGTAIARVVWDGASAYVPHDGAGTVGDVALVADDGRAIHAPKPVVPTAISSAAFQARFTPAEQQAVWTAAVAAPAIGQGLVLGLSNVTIDLSGCPAACANVAVKAWMDALVTAGAIAADREAAILTP